MAKKVQWHIYKIAKTPTYMGSTVAPDNDPDKAVANFIKENDITDETVKKKLTAVATARKG